MNRLLEAKIGESLYHQSHLTSSERRFMNVLFSRAGCFSLLCWWLVVDWTPVVKPLADDEDVATRANSLEEENVWFWVVYFVVFPAQALESRSGRGHHCEFDATGRTWVIPRPLHSSSQSNFKVPFAGSK
jgi:hypothetical protein